MKGWVKLHRRILDSPLWTRLAPPHLKVFLSCLLLANNQDRQWNDGHEDITILRGSFVTSQDSLARVAGVGRQVVRTALRSCHKQGSLLTKTLTKRYSLITVVNFPLYQGRDSDANQDPNQASNQDLTKSQPTANHNVRSRSKESKNLAGDSAPALVSPDTGRTKAPDPNVKLLIDHYHATFLARFGSPPPLNGLKCGAIAKKLLAGRTLEEAKWLITEHLTNPPDFFEGKNLYGLEHVLTAAPTLLARRAKTRELEP